MSALPHVDSPHARPKVALFSTEFLAFSQTFVDLEIRNRQRYDVEVFCARRLNTERFRHDPVHVAGPLYPYTRGSRAFARLFSERGYSLVHAHFGTGAVYALRYARSFGLPLVVTFHGYDVPLLRSWARVHPGNWRYALYGPKVLAGMTLGLCASRELRELLREAGAPEDRLRLHHIGIDVATHGCGARDPLAPRVVMIGRFVEKKGFEYGIRAFALAAPGTSAHLTVVGGGPLEPRLRALVASLGIADRVSFPGVLTSDAVAGLLAGSDVLLAPSVVSADGDRESGLVVAKEAAASAMAVIGTYHGGIPEIIEDGETGYLVPERDTAALAGRLGLLLAQPELRAKLGRAARVKMEREYDIRARVEALERHYDEARVLHRGRARVVTR